MAASNTRFTQNSLGQSKTPIDSDHGIYRYTGASLSACSAARPAWPLAAGVHQAAMRLIGFLQRSNPIRSDFADFRGL